MLLSVILLVVVAYLAAGGEEVFHIDTYQDMYQESPLATAIAFFMFFLLGTAMSLPLFGILSTISGVIFGALIGFPLALLACTLGGTLAYLTSRYILHDLIQGRFGDHLVELNKGIEKDGAFYVFGLRMIPVIPFWLINLLIGLTPITTVKYFFATLTGMIPLTVILVYFGSQIGSIESFSLRALFSPGLLLSLALLAALPFATRAIVSLVQRQRKHAPE
jgi:uncharacterized membrane protein YdjX (TVP38/TMEM64 family)